MLLDENSEQPVINYPCKWKYKIIGDNLEKMLNSIDDIIAGLDADLTPSNISRKGKYYSLNLIVSVNTQEERDSIYQSLKLCSSIKIVL